MFACSRYETKMIMDGKATGFARKYPAGCPHKCEDEIVLTSLYLDGSGRSIPFARVKIQTIRPGTASGFRRDPVIADMDGYKNGEHWYGQMSHMYSGLGIDEPMHHIKFSILEIDKEAGRRGDVKK